MIVRACEFISEGNSVGTIGKRRRFATVGLNKFRDANFADRTYEFNRVGMAAAATDGTFVPDIDGESWAGRYNIATPYTRQEQDILNQAYKAVGSWHKDLNSDDLRSQEIPGNIINKTSPVKAFKGYRR